MRALFTIVVICGVLTAPIATALSLRNDCPASFDLLDDGSCRLVTLYDFYDSPPQHGGVKANLPTLTSSYTPQQIDLGRYLFFDPLLSKNKDMSCASCHQLEKGLSDGRKQSLGAVENGHRLILNRSTPSLWNTAFYNRYMWDGRADSLLAQASLPLLAKEEMGNTKIELERSLSENEAYRGLFRQAYQAEPSLENTSHALAAFQSTLVSFNSRYDRYAHGDSEAMTETEIRGYNTFRGFVARCSQCHIPPLFTDSELAVVGAPAGEGKEIDLGAGNHSQDPFLRGAFKVPTLRNITRSAPYFHSGQFEDLKSVVDFYNDTRGHMAPNPEELKIHWHVHMTRGPALSEENVLDIVAFLATLEDETRLPKVPEILPSGLRPINQLVK